MISVLTGENDFEIEREIKRLTSDFDGDVERVEGKNVQAEQVPSLLFGSTLFSDKRLIIIRNLSENRSVWDTLPDGFAKIPGDIHVVLVESKLDKRTKTYKSLQKHAVIKEFKQWSERDSHVAEKWAVAEASRLGISLDTKAARLLVSRCLQVSEKGAVIDQWALPSNLQKLAPLKAIGVSDVEAYIDETPIENVFNLFETALKGDSGRVKEMIGRLEASEDPFKLFGLLSGQAFLLAVLSVAPQQGASVAKDFSAHPFVIGKLTPYAKSYGQKGTRQIASVFAEADAGMKTSAGEPWLLIERALIKVSQLVKTKNSA